MRATEYMLKHLPSYKTVAMIGGGAFATAFAGKVVGTGLYEPIVNQGLLNKEHGTRNLMGNLTQGTIQRIGEGGIRTSNRQYLSRKVIGNPLDGYSGGGTPFSPSGDIVLGMYNLR